MKKKLFRLLIIFVATLLSSCPNNKEEVKTGDFYYKCFFLGETSFLIEGETFHSVRESYDYTIATMGYGIVSLSFYTEPPLTEKIPFDSLVARISGKSDASDYYTEWEIPAIISESKFQLLVDITANGITIDKDIVTESGFTNALFPYVYTNNSGLSSYYPAFELKFYSNGREGRYGERPVFQEALENNKYCLYPYVYVYVAEPIDLSKTKKYEHSYIFGRNEYVLHHYDLDFSEPGWYKIIRRYYREVDNDPKFSTGENTYFLQ